MTAEEEKLPLHDEAKARDRWRGREAPVKQGEDRVLSAGKDGRPGKGGAGTIPPPD